MTTEAIQTPDARTPLVAGATLAAPLAFRYTPGYKKQWSDQHSGGDYRASFYSAAGFPFPYNAVGDYGQTNYDNPDGKLIVVQAVPDSGNGSPLAYSVGFDFVWNDDGTGKKVQDGSFWHLRCPAGYVSLGDVANVGWEEPDRQYVCVRQDLCEPATFGEVIWDSTKSGAKGTVSMWPIVPTGSTGLNSGTFYVKQGRRTPDPSTDKVWVLKNSSLSMF